MNAFNDYNSLVDFMADVYFKRSGPISFSPEEMSMVEALCQGHPNFWAEIFAKVEQLVINANEVGITFSDEHKEYLSGLLENAREKYGNLTQYLYDNKDNNLKR